MLIPFTPAAPLPTQLTSDSSNLIVFPALEKSIICFFPSVILTSIKLSPSFKLIAIKPDDLGLENSDNLVFLIMPLLVAINTNKFSS